MSFFRRISISLLEAPFPKLFQGFVAWYVTPPCVQLATLGAAVDELAC